MARWSEAIDQHEPDAHVEISREQGLIPFEWAQNRMTCQQAHLLSKVMGWNLAQVGKLIDEKEIKVKTCQLGLFK